MASTLEERVAYLEGRVEEHSRQWTEIKEAIMALDARMQAFEQRVDRRFEANDRRFESIDRRFESIERRIEHLDQKFSRYFLWIIGIQISILMAVIAVILRT
ncbi:MAG: hypothetical protein D6778_03940 [Nitrospirae bacterium]|nr:MAG: hypothetical protein D6778_03940 [Nitrospirota bacterium]